MKPHHWVCKILFLVALHISLHACSKGGTGIGTAPGETPPCPINEPISGSSCNSLQVCGYPLCNDATVCSPTRWAYCPGGTNAIWEVQILTDASLPQRETLEPEDAQSDVNDSAQDTLDADSLFDAFDSDSSLESGIDSRIDTNSDDSSFDSSIFQDVTDTSSNDTEQEADTSQVDSSSD